MVQFAPPAMTTLDLILYGTPGEEFLSGGSGNDRIYGYAGPDHLHGYTGDDFLFGGDGPDEIKGGVGNDHLYGGAGKDRLWGGKGADYVHGGAGADKIVFHPDGDTVIGGKGADNLRISLTPDDIGGGHATARIDGLDHIWLEGVTGYTVSDVVTDGARLEAFTLALDFDGRAATLDVFLNAATGTPDDYLILC